MKIQILGTGCPKCKQLLEVVRAVTLELSVQCEIEKITDINQIMSFGVMMTPALVIDGKVMCSGKIPTLSDMRKVLSGCLGK